MARYRHLPHAPITEAVLDFRVRPNVPISEELVNQFAEHVEDDYALTDRVEIEVSFPGGSKERARYRLNSTDEQWVIQLRTLGIAVSMLESYTNWEDLQTEALNQWRLYEQVFAPSHLVRISTRFINQLRFPPDGGHVDFSDYLCKPIGIPDGLPHPESYWMSYTFRESNDLVASITQALVDHDPEAITILLDIDAHQTIDDADVPVTGELLETVFKRLRKLKNKAFFSSITEETAQLYE